jgi:hypothetical protein
MNKEEIINEINRMIDLLEDVCGMDYNDIIQRIRELIGRE